MNTRFLLTTTMAGLVLGGCYLEIDKHDGQSPWLAEGAPCTEDDDCDAGLACIDAVCAVEATGSADSCNGGHGPEATGPDATGGADQGGGGQGGTAPACLDDIDCAEQEICTPEGACAVPSCEEIDSETTCLERADCETVYAGVDCSCGQGCTCQAGEPGCVCESFEFFQCEAL
jgi:hypothetical protein